MMQNRTYQTRGRAVLWCGCFALALARCASPQTPETAPRAVSPAIVPLVSGTCARVSEGDILTFEWNPAFDHPGAVAGISDFELAFASSTRENRSPRSAPAIRLIAMRRLHGDQTQITAAANGYFQLRFSVHLQSVVPGTYELVGAQAEPALAPDYQGERPHMTNSPLQSSFCLDVVAPASRRGRP